MFHTPSLVLSDSYWGLGGHIGCGELNQSQLRARPFLLSYLLRPHFSLRVLFSLLAFVQNFPKEEQGGFEERKKLVQGEVAKTLS